MWIAKEGLDLERLMQPVMLGEFGSVIEADGLSHRLGKPLELSSDGSCGENGRSIGGSANDVEAGLTLVKEEQALAISCEQHEVSFPMPRCGAIFDLGRSIADRAAMLDKAGGTAAWTSAAPSFEFAARQQAMPVILLGGPMVDKTVD